MNLFTCGICCGEKDENSGKNAGTPSGYAGFPLDADGNPDEIGSVTAINYAIQSFRLASGGDRGAALPEKRMRHSLPDTAKEIISSRASR